VGFFLNLFLDGKDIEPTGDIMRLLKRDYAVSISLKLNCLNRLRRVQQGIRCIRCQEIVGKDDFCFCILAYRDLVKPIETSTTIIKKVPFVYQRYCAQCAKLFFPECFKKDKK
jgi:hypothetical protein